MITGNITKAQRRHTVISNRIRMQSLVLFLLSFWEYVLSCYTKNQNQLELCISSQAFSKSDDNIQQVRSQFLPFRNDNEKIGKFLILKIPNKVLSFDIKNSFFKKLQVIFLTEIKIPQVCKQPPVTLSKINFKCLTITKYTMWFKKL